MACNALVGDCVTKEYAIKLSKAKHEVIYVTQTGSLGQSGYKGFGVVMLALS